MALTSFEYLIFFPLAFLLYWLFFNRSSKSQNVFILAASLIFYGFWDIRFLALLLFTAFSTYYIGLAIDRNHSNTSKSKCLLWLSIILNIGILFYFKYFNFFVDSFYEFLKLVDINVNNNSTLRIILPVGISFYTFSALSYTIDIFQNKTKPVNDIFAYLAYVTFFPAILSGPISRSTEQLPQFLAKREFDYDMAIKATKAILWGAFMKLCVADNIGTYVDTVYSKIEQHNGTTFYLTAILYSIQIYADFAGYSLMAIGSGNLLGIKLQTNFIRPYFSKTVTEFWRKWHISLTTWFRDYIYFPLGGNRVSKIRWIFNTMIVFTISGLWHGAAYTFVIWGALHGACMVIERFIYGDKIKSINNKISISNIARVILTFNIVTFAWIFFRVNSLSDAIYVIQSIFTDHGKPFIDIPVFMLSFMSIFIMVVKDFLDEKNIKFSLLDNKNMALRWITCVILICYILLFGALNGGSFIYFKF